MYANCCWLLARVMAVLLEPQGCFVRSYLHHRSLSPLIHSPVGVSSRTVHGLGLWEETGAPGENANSTLKEPSQDVEAFRLTTAPPRHLLIFSNSKLTQGFSSFKWRKMKRSNVPLFRVFYVIPRFKSVVSWICSGQTVMCCRGCGASRFI